ncbi:head-tail connector protein [Hymenobacter fodinae]|uniref:PhiE125 gp8 family phage protein n=1 Tax=Hymenobacter fodinae TaxID=2510796 RepID=A0A4Z0P2C0_9BACT|nr:head-tail connector protein [Hymenobacter fodinae]TGE05562.1 hypothetical protein EU556_19880 [Hymenobacter fodinae]
MPTAVVLSTTDPITEPVSMSVVLNHLRLEQSLLTSTDDTAKAEVEYLQLLLSSAREACEGGTGRYFAGGRTLELTYELREPYALPAGATATTVRGFFQSLDDLKGFNWEEYRKGATINRELSVGEAATQTYTVTVTLDDSLATQCPALAKIAILELTGEWYRNRETSSSAGIASRELPVSYRQKLAPLDIRPILV